MTESDLGPERTYFAALGRGELLIQKCNTCGQHVFYPRAVCPYCGSEALAWVKPTGKGSVYSTTVVRRTADVGPDLNVALVDLDEGVRLLSRVEGIPATSVKIGMKVTASIVASASGPIVVFNPVGAEHD